MYLSYHDTLEDAKAADAALQALITKIPKLARGGAIAVTAAAPVNSIKALMRAANKNN